MALRRRARGLYYPNEAIAMAGYGLDVNRVLGFVAQRFPQSPDRDIQAGLEFNEGVFRPELRFQLLARDQFPGTLQQGAQHQKRLGLEANPVAELAQITRIQIHFVGTEANRRADFESRTVVRAIGWSEMVAQSDRAVVRASELI